MNSTIQKSQEKYWEGAFDYVQSVTWAGGGCIRKYMHLSTN